VERLPRPPIRALAFHRKLHAALGRYHQFARRDGVVLEQDLLAAYDDLCDAGRDPEVRESRAYREGREILRRYCTAENEKQRMPAYLEHVIHLPFGPYELTGKIDRIDFTDDRGYSVVDYKLDRQLPGDNAADSSRQLSFYHLLVTEGLGVEPDDLRLYFLRHGVEHVSRRTRAQMRETVDWIDGVAASIHQEKRWEPAEGAGCASCAFRDICPAKTGREHPLAEVWQQGSLLWEMNAAPVNAPLPQAAAAPVHTDPRAPEQTAFDW
jgi:CRISPR/Cas system-associated exonuclease Cas4 (RecB family)